MQKEKRRNAPPPFTTSKLQQASYNRLRYTAKRTMGIAQKLYEGVELGDEGSVALITYMRTDSVRVSNDALEQVRALIPQQYGPEYLPERPNFYRSKKDAQDAHEAIRPTDAARTPDSVRRYLDDEAFKLYQLIWQRFVASQMVPAVFDQTTIDVAAGDYTFRASGSVEKFAGYLAAYRSGEEDLEKGDDAEAEGKASAARERKRNAEAGRRRTGRWRRSRASGALGTAFYGAASALHGSDAGEGVGGKRNRAAFHLCGDYFDDCRARVRDQRDGDNSLRRCWEEK